MTDDATCPVCGRCTATATPDGDWVLYECEADDCGTSSRKFGRVAQIDLSR